MKDERLHARKRIFAKLSLFICHRSLSNILRVLRGREKNWKFFLTSYNAMCYMYFHGISYKSAGHRAGKRYPAVLLDLPRAPGAGPGITERRRDRLGGRGSQHAHSDACPADAEQTTEP